MSEKIILTVQEGNIRGIRQQSKFSGVEYFSFYGVPYGQPTGGRSRFKDPVKVKPWKHVYDATTQREGCAQYSLQIFDILGNEDCLYNNIYIPQLPQKGDALRPVVVHIHPGSFYHGVPEPSQYGSPDFVMQHDIVYVCIAFRLHILGFLNLGLKECSGNQGLKDIILGLEWIKNNIHSFGGDPENITLLGSSTGATIIQLLMLSPITKVAVLFHKAVIMGMYVFGPVYRFKESHEQTAFEFAQVLGYEGELDDKKKLLSFLKKIPHETLSEEQYYFTKRLYEDYAPIIPMGAFLPTIDTGDHAVLPKSPIKLLNTMTRIPIIVGICDKESFMGFCRGKLRTSTEKHFKTSIRQNCWGWGKDLSDEDINHISDQIDSFYFNEKPIDDILEVKMNIQSDVTFSDIYDTLINPISEDLPSSVYVYKFDFEGKITSMKNITYFMFDEIVKGTVHGDDFAYWTCIEGPQNNETRQMIETFTNLLTTFARTGNPNCESLPIEWNPSTVENPCYLNIKKPMEMIDGKLNHERMQFWQDMKEKFQKNTNL